MQRMCTVLPPRVEAGGDELGFQLGRRVDPHVPADADRCVVLIAEHPVDLLWQPSRHGGREHAAGLEDAHHLGDGRNIVLDVFENF